jgi:hypothetical protein
MLTKCVERDDMGERQRSAVFGGLKITGAKVKKF